MQKINIFGNNIHSPPKREGLSINNSGEIFNANYNQYSNFYVYKLDSELNLLWEKYFSPNDFLFLRGVFATSDGGSFITAHTTGTINTIIIKTDSNGNVTSVNENERIYFRRS